MPVKNRKQSANIHDKRHENGLAPPAKQTSKSKADGQLGEYVNGGPSSPHLTDSTDVANTEDLEHSIPEGAADGSATATQMAPSRKASSDGGSEEPWEASADGAPDEQEAIIPASPNGVSHNGVNGSATKQEAPLSTNSVDPAATIIGTHPLRDVIAVLLVLLSLPPAALAIIQTCFTCMTFGNSSNGWAIASILSPYDWLHSHGGNPSIFTMLLTDGLIFFCWWILSGLLPILGNIALDLAQCVIAMSLGGGTATKGGWTHSLVCILIVALPHGLRISNWPHYAVDPLAAFITKMNVVPLSHVPIFLSTNHTNHSWLRVVLESHIIAQGTVRVVRRWFDRQPGTGPTKKGDPEAVATSSSTTVPISSDSGAEGARNVSTDGRPPGPSPALKDVKEKSVSSGKKRRKQGNFVRSRQPVWAAIASTKVILSREIEHSQASTDAFEVEDAEARDAKANSSEDRVWITRIEQTEIWFSAITRSVENRLDEGSAQNSRHVGDLQGMCIRINNFRWIHFEIKEIDAATDGLPTRGAYKGRIYGLTPSENFFVEFFHRTDNRVIYSAHLITRPVATTDSGSVMPPQPQESLRPSSPTTTLRKSIVAAENELTESRARSKKARKDHRTANSNLKKEVDGLETRLSTFSGTDERQRQRQAQFRQNIKQAEESVASMVLQIEYLTDAPESERQAYDLTRQAWQNEGERKVALRDELENSKIENERQMSAVRGENTSVRQKRERLDGRLGRLEQQRESLLSAIAFIRKEKARREGHRAATLAMYHARERELLHSLHTHDSQRQDAEARTAQLDHQIYYVESTTYGPPLNASSAISPSPDTSFPTLASGHRNTAFSNSLYTIGTPPVHSRQNSVRQKTRGRSSSMLSEISGFTDDETSGGAAPFDYAGASSSMVRNDSAGGSSGSRDPKGPTPKMSPIGTGIGRGSPKQYQG